MGCHNKFCTVSNTPLEWNQFAGFQLLQRLVRIGVTLVGIRRCGSMSREMLIGTQDALFLQAIRHGNCHIGNQLRIIAKGTIPDNSVFRITQNIRYRCKIQIKAQLCQIAADVLTHLFCGIHITCRADICHVSNLGDIKIAGTCNTCHCTALLIHTQECRKSGAFHAVGLHIF